MTCKIFSSNHRNFLIHTISFILNPSCIFWVTYDTKYIQTSNLKLSFENWETLLKFLIWLNPFQWICYNTYYEKSKTNTYFSHAKCVLQWKSSLWISCRKDQICCFSISSVVLYVFYKDFADCRLGAYRSSGFSDLVSNGATCIIFFISVRNLSSTNRNIFFLLEKIKSVHGILLMFAVIICGIFFAIGKK